MRSTGRTGLTVTAVVGTALLLGGMSTPAASKPAPRHTDRVLVFSKTAGLPPRLHPRRHRRAQGARREQTASASTRPRTRRRSPRTTSPGTTPSSSSPRPATYSTPASRRRSSATSPPAAATWASTRRRTPSTTGRSTAAWSAPTSRATRRSSRPRCGSRTAPTRRPRTCARSWSRTDEWYNYRTNPRGPVHVLATLDEIDATRRHDERRPPDRLVPELRGRPRLLHRRRPHQASATPNRRFRQHLLGGICASHRQGTGGLPPGERLPVALRRHLAGRVETGGPRRLHRLRRRHADVVRRHGPALVRRPELRRLLAEARLEGPRTTTTPVCSWASRPRTTRGRRSTRATRSRSTRPTPPTAPPGRCTASVPPT